MARTLKPVGTIEIEGGIHVNVMACGPQFEVWLDAKGDGAKSGTLLGVGKTTDTAMNDARKMLLRVLAETEGWDGRG